MSDEVTTSISMVAIAVNETVYGRKTMSLASRLSTSTAHKLKLTIIVYSYPSYYTIIGQYKFINF